MNIEKELHIVGKELHIVGKDGAERNAILVKAMEKEHEVYMKTFPVKEVDEETSVVTWPPSTSAQLKDRERSTQKFHAIARIFHRKNEVTEV